MNPQSRPGSRNSHAKLTEAQVRALRQLPRGKHGVGRMARELGISVQYAYKLRWNAATWMHVDMPHA